MKTTEKDYSKREVLETLINEMKRRCPNIEEYSKDNIMFNLQERAVLYSKAWKFFITVLEGRKGSRFTLTAIKRMRYLFGSCKDFKNLEIVYYPSQFIGIRLKATGTGDPYIPFNSNVELHRFQYVDNELIESIKEEIQRLETEFA